MTIASEITKLNTNLTNSYTACQNKGAILPASQNFDNLASTISAIPAATEPTLASLTVTPSTTAQTLTPPSGTDGYNTVIASAVTASIDSDIKASNIKSGVNILGVTGTYEGASATLTTKTITANGTYAASSDNADGYSSVTVNVSGGGGTKYSYPDVVGNYFVVTGGNKIPLSFSYNSTNFYLLENGTGVAFWDFGLGSPSISTTLSIPANYTLNFTDGTKLLHVSLNDFGASVTNVTYSAGTTGLLRNNTTLRSVRISNMRNLALRNLFSGCTNLSEVDVSTINSIRLSNALAGPASTGGAFANCTSLQTLSFNSLTSTSFGTNANQFNNMLKGVTGCTVHFPSNLQSVIGSWSSVTSGFGGTNTTVLFDLPATT